jgi:asparagine synthase (glutamine-hydrolysing)
LLPGRDPVSIQTGLYNFDGRPATHEDIAFLLTALESSCPDYAHIQLAKSLGMGFMGALLTPEDQPDQPITGADNLVMTFDGRLDNRAELLLLTGLGSNARVSDARLVLSVFERLGRTCFDILIGEYALVLWDGSTLFLARSQCGTRPLFYSINHRRAIWSSALDDLVLKTDLDTEPNDKYLIGFLYFHPDTDESPFRQVSVVPCGTWIAITAAGEVQGAVPTWHPERISTLVLQSDAEYEEAWRSEVKKAIASRLRASHPVFCELSGGFDSSTVVQFSDRILQETGRDSSFLTTISCTFETSRFFDESFFISTMERCRQRKGIRVSEEQHETSLGLEEVIFTGVPNVLHCFPGRYRAIEQAMRQAGARVLLTGNGGDELFSISQPGSPELSDLLAQGHLLKMIREAHDWSRVSGLPLWRVLLTSAVGPITAANRHLAWYPSVRNPAVHWISREARRWFTGEGRIVGLRLDGSLHPPSLRMRVHSIRSVSATIAAGHFNEYRYIYVSHPYTHRDLLDFMLSIPLGRIGRPGDKRSLMRRATAGILPEKIRARKSKGSMDEVFARMLVSESPKIGDLRTFEVCRRGYAEASALAEGIQQVTLGRLEHSAGLLRVFSLERWLRSLQTVACRRANVAAEWDKSRLNETFAHPA